MVDSEYGGPWQEVILEKGTGGVFEDFVDRGLEFRICILSAMGSCGKILSNVSSTGRLFNCHSGSAWVIQGGASGS